MKTQSLSMVRVVHGAAEERLPVVGHTIARIKRSLREGFGIPYFAEAYVDGLPVNADHVLGVCDVLEYVKTFGLKGGQAGIETEIEAEGLLTVYREELLEVGDQVKAMNLDSAKSVDVTVELVARWCQRKFGPLCEMDLPQVMRTLTHLGRLIHVSAEFQRCDAVGMPGRKTTTEDIAMFAYLHRSGEKTKTWKDIYIEWKTKNPSDDRVSTPEHIREAFRRHHGDKAGR